MDTKVCSMCNIEKHINNFYKRYSECKDCNRTRGLEFYSDNKNKLSKQQKIYYEKNREKYFYRNKTIDVYNLEIWSDHMLN